MMPSVADVDRDLAKLRFKHRMSGVTLEVVRRLVEISHPRNVILAVLPDVIPVVRNYNGRIPDGVVVVRVAFQDGRHDHHVVLLGQFLHELRRRTMFGVLGKLTPGELFAGAKCKWHCWNKIKQVITKQS